MTFDRIPIGTFSWITHLSRKALRLYDDRGLLIPDIRDIATGYRYYSIHQIDRGIRIKNLVTLGFSLEMIGAILKARENGDVDTIVTITRHRREEIRDDVRRLKQCEAHLAMHSASPELIEMTLSDPIIKEISPIRVIMKRSKGRYEETIPQLIRDLCRYLESPEAKLCGVSVTGTVMTIYHDEEYRETDADIEVAIPIAGRTAFETRTLPGGTFITAIYQGPYQGIHKGWSFLYAYAQSHGIPLIGPGREVYLNDPAETREEDLLTEMQMPVLEG